MEKNDKAISHFCLQLGRKSVENYLKKFDNDKQFLEAVNFEFPIEAKNDDYKSKLIEKLQMENAQLELEIVRLNTRLNYCEAQGRLFDSVVQCSRQTIKDLNETIEDLKERQRHF